MPMDLDATDFENEDDATYTGGDLLLGGYYHAELIEVDDRFEERELIVLNFRALNGTTPGQEGKTRKAFLDFSRDEDNANPNWKCEKSMVQAQQLAVVFKLKRLDEKKTVEYEDAIGRTCIVHFEESNKTDPKTGRPWVNYQRAYSLDNPEVVDVPRGETDAKDDSAAAETAPFRQGEEVGGTADTEQSWDDI